MAQGRPAALVTGSASGIGRAAALRLAQAGYDVAVAPWPARWTGPSAAWTRW